MEEQIIGIIESRDLYKVSLREGRICIEQDIGQGPPEVTAVNIHSDDFPKLNELLQTAYQRARTKQNPKR